MQLTWMATTANMCRRNGIVFHHWKACERWLMFPGLLSAGLLVDDAKHAYETSIANGGVGVLPPTVLPDEASGTSQVIAEVKLYGDVVLRCVAGNVHACMFTSKHARNAYESVN